MNAPINTSQLSRRALLKGGALTVAFAMSGTTSGLLKQAIAQGAPARNLDPNSVDAFFAIGADGRIEPGGAQPGALVTLHGISGATPLADEVRYLARHLRWDAEEELSRIVGDVAAHRLADGVRAFIGWQRDSAIRIGEALVDYAVQERGALVRRTELGQLAGDIERFAQALEALENRVSHLD